MKREPSLRIREKGWKKVWIWLVCQLVDFFKPSALIIWAKQFWEALLMDCSKIGLDLTEPFLGEKKLGFSRSKWLQWHWNPVILVVFRLLYCPNLQHKNNPDMRLRFSCFEQFLDCFWLATWNSGRYTGRFAIHQGPLAPRVNHKITIRSAARLFFDKTEHLKDLELKIKLCYDDLACVALNNLLHLFGLCLAHGNSFTGMTSFFAEYRNSSLAKKPFIWTGEGAMNWENFKLVSHFNFGSQVQIARFRCNFNHSIGEWF